MMTIFGKYRNRYTDYVRVRHKIHSTANTDVIYFEKQLLALKEDSLPYGMNLDTLEAKGMCIASVANSSLWAIRRKE